jgi:fatty acid desaturase
VNDFVGEYLCALPTFNSLAGYRAYHMAHHRLAGTSEDPDLHMTTISCQQSQLTTQTIARPQWDLRA